MLDIGIGCFAATFVFLLVLVFNLHKREGIVELCIILVVLSFAAGLVLVMVDQSNKEYATNQRELKADLHAVAHTALAKHFVHPRHVSLDYGTLMVTNYTCNVKIHFAVTQSGKFAVKNFFVRIDNGLAMVVITGDNLNKAVPCPIK